MLPLYSNIPHQSGTFVPIDEPMLTHCSHQKSIVPLAFTPGVHSTGLDKCIMRCSHHYNIKHSIFTALKILCVPPVHLSLPPTPRNNNWSFYHLHSFPFPECRIVGILHCVAFSDWIPSLSNVHLRFLHVSSWFDSSFLFSTE